MRFPLLALPFLAAALVAAAAGPAEAQRGEAFIEQSAPPETPLSGFPGLADTNTVPAGDVVVDLPLLSVDAGVTENLSVGANALAFMPLAGGQLSFLGRTRYRWFSSDRVVSVVDGTAGYMSLGDEGRLRLLLFGSNTTVHFGRVQSLTVTALAARANVDRELEEPEGAMERSELSALALALTYQLNPLDWLALRFTAAQLPFAIGQVDTSFQFAELEFGADKELWKRTVFRGLASFRLGESWLLGGGAFVHTGGAILPWASLAKRW